MAEWQRCIRSGVLRAECVVYLPIGCCDGAMQLAVSYNELVTPPRVNVHVRRMDGGGAVLFVRVRTMMRVVPC